jgi:hypothetical protein
MQLDYENPIDRLARRPKRWRKVLVWSGAMIAALVLFALVMLPTLGRPRETANRVKCASNLRQIGQAAILYANENGGHLPPDLPTLLDTQDVPAEIFICASSNVEKATGPTTQQVTKSLLAGDHTSYAWAGAGLTTAAPADAILAFDLELHVPKDGATNAGINVLLNDGTVTFVNEPTAKAIRAHFVAGVRPIRLSTCTPLAVTAPASPP